MIALIKGLQLLLSLSLLVVLHEFGHYLAARLFKTRVEKFYLFMNPWFSLYKKQIGETEWGIGWLPLGGYVKISGMVDESMDKDQMKLPPQPHEFRSKPAWQRLIIMLGGIIVNLLVGFMIYSMVLFVWGEKVLPNEHSVNIHPDLVEECGFQNGDKIIKYNGEDIASFKDLRLTPFFKTVNSATVLREGITVELQFEKELGQILLDGGIRSPFSLQLPALIDSIVPDSRAELSGLLPGDIIEFVGEKKTGTMVTTKTVLENQPNTPIVLRVLRNDALQNIPVMTDSLGHLGFHYADPSTFADNFQYDEIEYTLGQSIVSGFFLASNTLREYALQLRFLASSSGAKQVGSLVTFGNAFDANWDWHRFWSLTAFFSLILAFMNLLPIPALDGGHVVFLLYEMVVGKPAPDKVLEIAQAIGIILLLGLMVFALGNDFLKLFTGGFG